MNVQKSQEKELTVIREQNKTKILYHFNPNKVGKIKNMRNITCQPGSDMILLSIMLLRI